MSLRTFVVHGLKPMTVAELSALSCGHCRHALSYHLTPGAGLTHCVICSCLRHPGEDILSPHSFAAVDGGQS